MGRCGTWRFLGVVADRRRRLPISLCLNAFKVDCQPSAIGWSLSARFSKDSPRSPRHREASKRSGGQCDASQRHSNRGAAPNRDRMSVRCIARRCSAPPKHDQPCADAAPTGRQRPRCRVLQDRQRAQRAAEPSRSCSARTWVEPRQLQQRHRRQPLFQGRGRRRDPDRRRRTLASAADAADAGIPGQATAGRDSPRSHCHAGRAVRLRCRKRPRGESVRCDRRGDSLNYHPRAVRNGPSSCSSSTAARLAASSTTRVHCFPAPQARVQETRCTDKSAGRCPRRPPKITGRPYRH